MRKRFLQFLVPALVGSALAGCVQSHRAEVRRTPTVVYPAGEVVVVVETPPAPRQEVVGTAPDETQVWLAGHWMNQKGSWVWVTGHWEVRPGPMALWYAGHWDKRADGRWVWTPGYWN